MDHDQFGKIADFIWRIADDVRGSGADGGADAQHERLHGRIHAEIGGHVVVNAHQPDSELRDTEQAPLLEPGGIGAFVEREVWPYAPGAWVDGSKTAIGYEIAFSRYFYELTPLGCLADICADFEALEAETGGLLRQVLEVQA